MQLERLLWTIPLRLRSIFRRTRVEAELDEELRYHIEAQAALNVAHGMSPRDARAAAMRAMGGVAFQKDEIRDRRRVEWISTLIKDVRYGMRLLRRAPVFSAGAVATVAVSIAGTTAMFSIVYGVLLRPLPFKEPTRLVHVWTTASKLGYPRAPVGAANAKDWRARNRVFEDLALVRTIANFNITDGGEPERVLGARLSSNLLGVLGVQPMLGRGFADEEDEIGHDQVVLLSHRLWMRRFNQDSTMVGRTITMSGVPYRVIGIMGPDFVYPTREFALWTPLTINPVDYVKRTNFGLVAVARLKPGVTIGQAQRDLNAISMALQRDYPQSNGAMQIGAEVVPMLDDSVSTVRRPLFVLIGAVGALLLIGCANLTNLLLVRALIRQRELSVRAALGASRSRLVVQSLAELVPVLVLGAATGVGLAWLALRLVLPNLPPDMPRVENVGLHAPVLATAAGTLLLIGLVAGAWPAIDSSRAELIEAMNDITRGGTSSRRRARLRDVLVVAQVSATLLLFIYATVLARSFVNLRQVNPGFDAEHVLSAHFAVPRSKYQDDPAVAAFWTRILDRAASLPGVESVGMVNRLPLAGTGQTGDLEFEGLPPEIGHIEQADLRTTTPQYFAAMRIPLREGRVFTTGDDANAPAVGLIDDQLARKVFGRISPIGRRFRASDKDPWATIVGVVGHVRHDKLEEDSRSQAYWNYLQRPQDRGALVIRTAGNASSMVRPLVAAVQAVDPAQPVYDVRELGEVVSRSIGRRWLQSTLLGLFAAVALGLACIGVYGVMAFGVGQRRREFGIRMALGARQVEIVTLVLTGGARLLGIGLVIGLVFAAASAGVLRSLVFGIQPLDPVSFFIGTIVLFTAGLVACYLPSHRAAQVDPTEALRAE
jgi:putative ABC transport system permease protein